ncbi:TetR/AcrR family transcriptional regulator [Peribacillus butanolivorans]|uniref:TetR/AcrR family transcriptional regulator n=1 Tax=Peribacillus butanolivorans TaxID=421767 RepID=UPI00207C4718|nr:TetR/AcrR family transcriptional regulator [Peribacillus butanolivorans]MCO0597785.1 TetR/AcrR family transcriptional regulator [Peribacillus butanolivorans]
MSRKEIQISRMWHYFVEATIDIIEQEGLENVTARKIADKAGYTVSTIYNYFEELSHLIFFSAMKYLQEYTEEIPFYMNNGKNYLEKYLLTWECFCKHSFKRPKIYHSIFIANLGNKPDILLKHYYSVYPKDLIGIPEEVRHLLFEQDLYKRNKPFLEFALSEGSITGGNIDEVTDLTILTWTAMMTMLLNNRRNYSPEKAEEITMKHIRSITSRFLEIP